MKPNFDSFFAQARVIERSNKPHDIQKVVRTIRLRRPSALFELEMAVRTAQETQLSEAEKCHWLNVIEEAKQ